MVVPKISETPCMTLTQIHENFNDSKNTKKCCLFKFSSLLGFFYTCLSSISFSLLSVSVKKIPYVNSSQLSLIRNVGVFIGAFSISVYINKENFVEKQDAYFLIFRGFLSATAYYTIIISYKCLPLAEAAIISSSQPIVTTVLARIYLKETCGWVLTISLIVNILGILLSVRLPEILFNRENFQINSYYLGGLAAGIAAVLLRGLSAIFIRKLKHIHFSIVILYSGFIGIIENTVITTMAFSFVSSKCGWDQILCMSVGIFGCMESAWNVLGVQNQPAGLVSVERASLDIPTLAVFQILFFQEYPDNYVICGACLVILSLGIIGLRTCLLIMPEESAIRKKLKCFEK